MITDNKTYWILHHLNHLGNLRFHFGAFLHQYTILNRISNNENYHNFGIYSVLWIVEACILFSFLHLLIIQSFKFNVKIKVWLLWIKNYYESNLKTSTFYNTFFVKQTMPWKTGWVRKLMTAFIFIRPIRTVFLWITYTRFFNAKSIFTSPTLISLRSTTNVRGIYPFLVAYIIGFPTDKSFSIPRLASSFY